MAYFEEKKQDKVRVFTSFDFDHDQSIKNLLVGQSRNSDSPFEIEDWSVKEPIAVNWKEKVRERIKKTQQVIIMCGEYTDVAAGVEAEVIIAQEESIPYFLLAGYKDKNCKKPPAAKNEKMYIWTWEYLKTLIHGGR